MGTSAARGAAKAPEAAPSPPPAGRPVIGQDLRPDPGEHLSQMPARQMVAVLCAVLGELRESDDYVCLALLLSDLGRAMGPRAEQTEGKGFAYSVLREAVSRAERRFGPDEGCPRRPGPLQRLWRRLREGGC